VINVNRQYGHLGGKMRGVIQRNLQRAGYARRSADRDALPVLTNPSVPPMLPTHTPPEGSAVLSPPRNCVRVYNLGAGRVLVLSFDSAGLVVERYEGPRWMVTDRKLEAMHANLSATAPETVPALKLVTD
jgi:hypothetical protein